MLKKLDKDFAETLEDDTKLEKQIAALSKQRLWNVIAAAALAALIYGFVLFLLATYKSSISAATPFGINAPTPMVLMPSIFSPLLLIHAVKAVAAHCEIRTLLTFKRLLSIRTRMYEGLEHQKSPAAAHTDY